MTQGNADPFETTITNLLSELGLATSLHSLSLTECASDTPSWVKTKMPAGHRCQSSKPCNDCRTAKRWLLSLRRAAQAWISVYEALTCDTDLPYEVGGAVAKRTILFMAWLDYNELLLNWIKETSCLIAAKAYRQDLTNEESCRNLYNEILAIPGIPKPPAFGTLGFGWVRDRCKWISLRRPKASASFREVVLRAAHNIQFVKRGMPCMLPALVEGAMKKHMATLSSEPRTSSEDEVTLAAVEEAVSAVVREVFVGKVFDPEEVTPSINASYSGPRSRGGAAGSLIHNWVRSPSRSFQSMVACAPILPSVVLESCVEVRPGELHWFYVDPEQRELLSRFSRWCSEDAVKTVVPLAPVSVPCTDGSTVLVVDHENRILASPAPILEPCKCRIITKAEAPIVQRGFSLQKFLHGTLKEIDIFEFIGRPINEDLWDLAMGMELPSSCAWLSGDFKGATDNLKSRLSEHAWKEIAKRVAVRSGFHARESIFLTSWYNVGLCLLTRHRLDYSSAIGHKKDGEEPDLMVDQKNGQLMGSPVSFPILNLVNAAAAAVGLGWSEDAGSILEFLRMHHIRTNGDDIVGMIERDQYPDWIKTCTVCGLVPSLGKNFLSAEFAEMNSEMRRFIPVTGPCQGPEGGRVGRWEPLSFVNLPILLGIEAKGIEAGRSVLARLAWFEVAPLANALVRWCEPICASRRVTRFMKYYETVLRRVPPGVGYHIPARLGGVGIPDPLGCTSYTEGNLKRAAWLACLDPQKAAEELAPPPRCPSGVMDGLCKEALSARVTRSFVFEKDIGEEELARLTCQTRLAASVWASVLYRLYRECVNGGTLYTFFRDDHAASTWSRVEKDGKPYTLVYQDHDLTWVPERRIEQDHLVREQRFARRISKQCARANRSSLQPMSAGSLCGWDRMTIEEKVDIGPSYRVKLYDLAAARNSCVVEPLVELPPRAIPDVPEWIFKFL